MYRVHNLTRDQLLGSRVAVARTFFSRLRGLIGQRAWGERDGLWIEPCTGVHSFGMRFPIDLVLVDEAMIVLLIQPALRPWRLGRISLAARAALELPVETLSRTGTRPGDQLELGAQDLPGHDEVDDPRGPR